MPCRSLAPSFLKYMFSLCLSYLRRIKRTLSLSQPSLINLQNLFRVRLQSSYRKLVIKRVLLKLQGKVKGICSGVCPGLLLLVCFHGLDHDGLVCGELIVKEWELLDGFRRHYDHLVVKMLLLLCPFVLAIFEVQ